MTDYLYQIAARIEAATEGPWVVQDGVYVPYVRSGGDVSIAGAGMAYNAGERDDAEFIAHARTDLPRLLAAVRAVEALHVEGVWEGECPNPRHTNLDVQCPDCLTFCVECGAVYPCPTLHALTKALEGER